jgi:hypothetical protein
MVYSPKMYLDVFYFSIKKIKEKRRSRRSTSYLCQPCLGYIF